MHLSRRGRRYDSPVRKKPWDLRNLASPGFLLARDHLPEP